MKCFLVATFVVACFAPVALAEESDRGQGGYEIVKTADGTVIQRRIETPETLRERYLNEAAEFTKQLSEQELMVLLADLREKQTAFNKDHERKRLADDIEKRLEDVAEYLQTIAGETTGTDAAAIALQIRKTLLEDIATVKKWGSGSLVVPAGLRAYPVEPKRVSR